MLKNIKIVRSYYKLAGVRGHLVFFEFALLLLPSILSILSTILAANIISAITVYDFSLAIEFLCLDFAFILVSAASYFGYFLLNKKVSKTILFNINNFIYSNLKQNKSVNKISMTTASNVNSFVEFNKDLLYKICFLIKSIVIISVVLYYNLLVGFGIFAVSLVTYFLLKITDRKIQTENERHTKLQASSVELLGSIIKGIKDDKSEDVEQRLKDKYFSKVGEVSESKNTITKMFFINNNFISLILKCAVFGFSVYLLLLVKATTLTLSLYLILTPYLTSSAQNLISFFELFSEIGLIDNIICEFESFKFKVDPVAVPSGELAIDSYNLYFYHTSYSGSKGFAEGLKKQSRKNSMALPQKNSTALPKSKVGGVAVPLSISLENSYAQAEPKTSDKKADNAKSKSKRNSDGGESDFLPKFVDDNALPPIFDLNIKIPHKTFVCFEGEEDDGTKAIFGLLKRSVPTSEGSIFLDYKNIAEIDTNFYKQIVSFSASEPHFFNISIIENLLLVCENRSTIESVLQACNLKKEIDRLPEGMNTVVGESTNKKLLYFLGIVREFLFGAKIINIFGVPENMNSNEKLLLLRLLKFLKGKCTVITYAKDDIFFKLADTTYYVADNKISKIVSLASKHKKELSLFET